MSDACREIGSIETSDGEISVGTDCGKVGVYVGGWLSADGVLLDGDQAGEFAKLFVAATWQAAQDEGAGGRPHPAVEASGGEPAAGTSRGSVSAAGELGMTDAEFERRLRLLMRVNPRLLETFFERAARRNAGRGFGRD